MQDLLSMLVRSLVDDPEAVKINEVSAGSTHILEVDVAEADRGKVIGRGGSTAEALRTILKAAGGRDGKRYVLEIVEG